MILATIELSNGGHLQLDAGRWTGDDAAVVAEANAFLPSQRYIPKSFANPAVAIAGLAAELAAKIGGKLVYVYSRDATRGQPHVSSTSRPTRACIRATVELPDGARIHLGSDRRWSGDDAVFIAMATAYGEPMGRYPNTSAALADEIAELLGGKVIFIAQPPPLPPGALS